MLAKLLPLLLQISIGAIVVSMALRSQGGELASLLRRPSLLLRSVLSMNVVTPLIAAGLAAAFSLRPAVEAALLLLAVAPVPPVLPGKQTKAGGEVSYAMGLLTVAALLAIVAVPFSIDVIGRAFGHDLYVPFAAVAKVVLMTVLGPLAVGFLVRRLAPAFAARIADPLSKVATLVLLAGFVLILIKAGPALLAQVGDGTLLAIVVFTGLSLLAGHLLGGPDPANRTVLALATASRHPGVALAVAGAIVPPDQRPGLSAAVFFCVLVSTLLTVPYVAWRKKRAAAVPAAA